METNELFESGPPSETKVAAQSEDTDAQQAVAARLAAVPCASCSEGMAFAQPGGETDQVMPERQHTRGGATSCGVGGQDFVEHACEFAALNSVDAYDEAAQRAQAAFKSGDCDAACAVWLAWAKSANPGRHSCMRSAAASPGMLARVGMAGLTSTAGYLPVVHMPVLGSLTSAPARAFHEAFL